MASGGIPGPVSSTPTVIMFPESSMRATTRPRCGVNFTALASKIGNDLHQALTVPRGHHGMRRSNEMKVDAMAVGEQAILLDRFFDQIDEVDFVALELEAGAFEASEFEKVVDQRDQ